MPLDAASIIQTSKGGFITASDAATLPAGVTGGNTVLLVVFAYGGIAAAIPDGFDEDLRVGATRFVQFFRRPNTPDGETSWTLTIGTANVGAAWVAAELAGVDPGAPTVATAGIGDQASATTMSTTTTGTYTPTDVLAVAAHGMHRTATTAFTWGAHTNGYVEVDEMDVANPSTYEALSVSRLFPGAASAQECTATPSFTPGTNDFATAGLVVYRAATVAVVPGPTMLAV